MAEAAESDDKTSLESFQTHVECDGCDEEERQVHWYCLTCKASLCGKCKSMKIHRSHTVKSWLDLDAVDARQNAPISCEKHKNEVFVTFCLTCQILCCAICVPESHARHSFSTIDEAYQLTFNKLSATLKMLQQNFLPKTEGKISEIENVKREHKNRKTKNLEKFRGRIEALKKCLEEIEKELCEKEANFCRKYIEPLSEHAQTLMTQKQQINQLITEISKELSSPNKSRLIAQCQKLHDVNKLRPLPLPPNLQEYPVFENSNFEFPDVDVCIGKYRSKDEMVISSCDIELDIKLLDDGEWEIWNGTLSNATFVTIWRKVERKTNDPDGVAALNILKECRHDNIVRLLASYVQEDQLYFVTEKRSRAILRSFLRENGKKGIEFALLMDFVYQIASGMCFLESKDVVHRNLTTNSVLVSHDFTLRIGEISRVCQGNQVGLLQGYRIPLRWTAPEAVKHGDFSTKSDVWSFGVLLVEIVTYGQQPYHGMQNKEVVKKIEKGYRHPKPEKCPDALYAIMLKCWDKQAVKRPTFEYLSGFFENYLVSFEHEYDEIED